MSITTTIIGTDDADFIDALTHPNAASPFFIDGQLGDDTIIGGLTSDTIIGGGGNDSISLSANSGNDIIRHRPGDGHDVISGFQSFSFGIDQDQIDLTEHGVLFSELVISPDDPMVGAAGTQILLPSGETIHIENTTAILSPLDFIGLAENTDGDDLIIDSFGDTNLSGADGDDTIEAAGGNNSFAGDTGNDWLDYSNQDAHVAASLTDDMAVSLDSSYTFSVDRTVDPSDLYGLNEVIYTDNLTDIENLIGSRFDDILEGNGAANQLYGGGGDDTLVSISGSDTLTGGEGADHFTLGRAVFSQAKVTTITDFEVFKDNINLSAFRYDYSSLDISLDLTGQNTIITLPNADQIILSNYSGPLSEENFIFVDTGGEFTFINLTAGNDLYVGIDDPELIRGFQGDDTIFAGGGDDIINGGEGDDQIDGGAGDDRIFDLSGANIITGGPGNDIFTVANDGSRLTGGEGRDFFTYDDQAREMPGTITITDFEQGFDRIGLGGLGIDLDDDVTIFINGTGTLLTLGTNGHRLFLEGFTGRLTTEDLSEETWPDPEQIVRGSGNDSFAGEIYQTSILSGGDGDDTLQGFIGNDFVIGGAGDDYLRAERDNNVLSGGLGADTFDFPIFALGDNIITDFEVGLDIIDFAFTGLDFSLLTITGSGNDTIIGFIDQDGSITLENVLPSLITEDDFLF